MRIKLQQKSARYRIWRSSLLSWRIASEKRFVREKTASQKFCRGRWALTRTIQEEQRTPIRERTIQMLEILKMAQRILTGMEMQIREPIRMLRTAQRMKAKMQIQIQMTRTARRMRTKMRIQMTRTTRRMRTKMRIQMTRTTRRMRTKMQIQMTQTA